MAWRFSTRTSVATLLITHPCISSIYELSHWCLDKMVAILQMAISDAFSWMEKFWCRLEFRSNVFLKIQLVEWLGAVRYQASVWTNVDMIYIRGKVALICQLSFYHVPLMNKIICILKVEMEMVWSRLCKYTINDDNQCDSNSKSIIFNLVIQNSSLATHSEIALR